MSAGRLIVFLVVCLIAFVAGGWLGLAITVVVWFVIAMGWRAEWRSTLERRRVPCSWCAESIEPEARVCPHCQRAPELALPKPSAATGDIAAALATFIVLTALVSLIAKLTM